MRAVPKRKGACRESFAVDKPYRSVHRWNLERMVIVQGQADHLIHQVVRDIQTGVQIMRRRSSLVSRVNP